MYDESIYFLIGGLCICSFMIGRNWAEWRSGQTISSVIEHLIDEGYLRSHVNADGDLELIKLRESFNGWNNTSSDKE